MGCSKVCLTQRRSAYSTCDLQISDAGAAILSANFEFPLAFIVEIQKLVVQLPAIVDSDAIILYTRNTACTKPFYPAYISHTNSGLDTSLKHFETDRTGRHRTYIKNCKHVNWLPHQVVAAFLSRQDNYSRTNVLISISDEFFIKNRKNRIL